MGRTMGFDRSAVVDAALDEFWAHGYNGTSTERLCAVTGLGRSSLYNAFHSKRGLYVECMAAYIEAADRGVDAILSTESTTSVLERISKIFEVLIDGEMERRAQGRPSGCFSVNTALEAGDDPEMAEPLKQITVNLRNRLAIMADYLAAGQAAGDIACTMPPTEQAEVINGAVVGIRVAARVGAARSSMHAIANGTLRALTPS
ncbi:TetR/AcrR family transcriptional regulator [Gordonia sp. MP11Mi]|uniref:TetR/AcrR family transcriptional regulator n=1 Tax=Gordonia sp. MP11Mi TaxID=3022769 RepID=UPI003B227DC7